MQKLNLVSLAVAFFAVPNVGAAAPVFDSGVRQILEENCVRCHGVGEQKGGLALHTREAIISGGDSGPALVPGQPDDSELIYRVCLPPEHDDVMPQESTVLTPRQTTLLKQWVSAGAYWPEGLVLHPTRRDEGDQFARLESLPAPRTIADSSKQLDELLAEETGTRFSGLRHSSKGIDDLAFLRRSTIDLIGRIPTYLEVQEFLSWSAGGRRAKLVSKLVDHPRFSDRWAVFFSDLLRVRTGAPGGSQLLAYLHQSIEQDKPYDSLVRELISATGRPGANPAVGFVLGDDADPMALAGATSQVFLGVRLACAECHDHPFDDWNQRQFYELAAFFGRTKKVENRFANTLFAVDNGETSVRWPPEREGAESRSPVNPLFPFQLAGGTEDVSYLKRFRNVRGEAKLDEAAPDLSLDELLDQSVTSKKTPHDLPDIALEVRQESAKLSSKSALESTSELRTRLADLITDPRNAFFARAFVNRVWFELNGRGFVEPLDNFSSYREISHPVSLEFLAREFVASGYDLKALVTMISLTETYARAGLDAELPEPEREELERAFLISPTRRMLSEVLFDSILVAGHLFQKKWPDGANVRTRQRQIRVPIVEPSMEESSPAPNSPPSMERSAPEFVAGYDLEQSIELDFNAALSGAMDASRELGQMKQAADRQIERQNQEMEMQAMAAARPTRYRLETVEEKVDDNPVFTSTMRMATPAPPAHFLRVFGQPSREGLGEFRDHSSSLRQQLMMLNGRVTHEAARVGSLEPLHSIIEDPGKDLTDVLKYLYLETLTREPSTEELAEGTKIVSGSENLHEAVADLRWALLNCHEFRFTP